MSANVRVTRVGGTRFGLLALAATVLFVFSAGLLCAQTPSTGAILGKVTGRANAAVGGATITISNTATGQKLTTTTSPNGVYSASALAPGGYSIQIEAKGFKTEELGVNVHVGETASGDIRLLPAESTPVPRAKESGLAVNLSQPAVQGGIVAAEIENLPVNGRNFLNLAELEPGIQMLDGGSLAPSKKGFPSISVGGRLGRSTLVQVDGVDLTDETVGMTTQNIPQNAIQELQVSQSMLDPSIGPTASGAVNMITRSGANAYHGEGHFYIRDQSLDANLPAASHNYLQRNHFGGTFGGALIPNKLFFFLGGERTKQDFLQPVLAAPPFQNLGGAFSSPFREGEGIGRVDWRINDNYRTFYRFSYDENSDISALEPASYQPLNNRVYGRDFAAGLDFARGSYTHSVRVGYLNFADHIGSATSAATPFNPTSPIELAIGPDPLCRSLSGLATDAFCAGQSAMAPQSTIQSDYQFQYDGSRVFGSHAVRFGAGFNRIQVGAFLGLLGNGPAVNASAWACSGTCLTLPGGAANALNYPATNVLLGNGQGALSEKSAFGLAGGGLGPDNRLAFYFADSWKMKPNLTVSYGVRYVRDTGRTDNDLGPIAALNQFGAGLGNRVNQSNLNFAPQLGLAWDPYKTGKTVFRAGIGLFYDNSLWNNLLFDRSARLSQGHFLETQPACQNGLPIPLLLPGTATTVTPSFCGQPIGQVQDQIAALQAQYQAAAASATANPAYIGNALAATGPYGTNTTLLAPTYKTPRSVQVNFGVQRQIGHGVLFSVDYLHNVSTHTLLAVDTNHVGDARYLNVNAALAAINATVTPAGCGPVTSAGANSEAAVNCYLGTVPGANISDFAVNGLDSGYSLCGGGPCPVAAFSGVNGSLGGNQMLFASGRSVYNGLQTSVKADLSRPFRGVQSMALQVSYALSHYVSMTQDSDVGDSAWDYSSPNFFRGPSGLDRRHEVSFGGTMNLPWSFRLGFLSHFDSPLAQTLTLQTTGQPGGIFVTDVTGDGTGDGSLANGSHGGLGDILPGTSLGSFGRSVKASNINEAIAKYNGSFAGLPTPAGQALVTANLLTRTQLSALGAVMPLVNAAPPDQAANGWLRTLDLNLSWVYRIKDRFTIQPGVSFFNALNYANFDAPENMMSGVLSTAGTAPVLGSANGTPGRQPETLRVGPGSGVFGLGSPRVLEFSLKVAF
jgi:Carboxypeptidase regulatory-like domain